MVLAEIVSNMNSDMLAIIILAAILIMEIITMLIQVRQAGSMRKLEEETREYIQQMMQNKRTQMEHDLADEIAVKNPKDWLESVIGNVTGVRPDLQEISLVEISKSPEVVVIKCDTMDFKRFIFAPGISPKELYRLAKPSKKDGLNAREPSIFGKNPKRHLEPIKLSVLNAGMFFDQQVKNAWEQLANGKELSTDDLMLYVLDLS